MLYLCVFCWVIRLEYSDTHDVDSFNNVANMFTNKYEYKIVYKNDALFKSEIYRISVILLISRRNFASGITVPIFRFAHCCLIPFPYFSMFLLWYRETFFIWWRVSLVAVHNRFTLLTNAQEARVFFISIEPVGDICCCDLYFTRL
jgi:hypothetical protein